MSFLHCSCISRINTIISANNLDGRKVEQCEAAYGNELDGLTSLDEASSALPDAIAKSLEICIICRITGYWSAVRVTRPILPSAKEQQDASCIRGSQKLAVNCSSQASP